jgi:hypothetical protein
MEEGTPSVMLQPGSTQRQPNEIAACFADRLLSCSKMGRANSEGTAAG